MIKKVIYFSIVGFGLFVLMLVIAIALPAKYKTTHGQITNVYEGGVKDAVFELAESRDMFYLNRAYQGYGKVSMEKLVGENVAIIYAEKWTPLDLFGYGHRSIVELKVGDAIYVQH